MSCGMCGSGRTPRRYQVTLTAPEHRGAQKDFLSEVEARVYAAKNGGGTIKIIT